MMDVVPPPALCDWQSQRDRDQIDLLAVFHFVFAGLSLLGIGFLALHYFLVRTVLSFEAARHAATSRPNAEVFVVMHVLIWFYVAIGAVVIAGGAVNLISGLCLRRRRNRLFSMVVAGLDCLAMPMGTILGVFTLVVLTRESVRRLYEQGGRR